MVDWLFPWAFLLLPLPLAVKAIFRPGEYQGKALRVPFFASLAAGNKLKVPPGVRWRISWWDAMVWVLLVCALARPQWLGEPVAVQKSTRDFLVAVDISQSMDTGDMESREGEAITRFEAVKTFLATLVASRESERFALVVFASAPFLQTPFTLDHALFTTVLGDIRVGMAGPRTMLGDGIGLAIRHFSGVDGDPLNDSDSLDKVVLLITDGVDSGSDVPVPEAARVAASRGITIHTVLVGRDGQRGSQAVDPALLREVSSITGGRFFLARDERSLVEVKKALDRVSPETQAFAEYHPRRELYYWFLGAALLGTLANSLLSSWRANRNARGGAA